MTTGTNLKRFLNIFFLGLGLVMAFQACREGGEPPREIERPKPQEETKTKPVEETPPEPMARVAPDFWPLLTDDLDRYSLMEALEQSRTYLKRLPEDRAFVYGTDRYSAAQLLASLDAFEKLFETLGAGPRLTEKMKAHFILYQSIGRDGKGEVLCTGYFEPLLLGSLKPDGRFRWPIYALPDDIIEANLGDFDPKLAGKKIKGRLEGTRLVPFYSRNQIDHQKALEGRNLELVWVDDPVGLFFLHIQGSGRVQLPDGRILRLGYAGANGRPYSSLGRYMIEQGWIPVEKMSMQAISKWLAEHPDQIPEVLDVNESYVFFRELQTDPLGNINVPLTPNRSVALDHRIFPKGALAWLETNIPLVKMDQVIERTPAARFVLVQDTGGAIKGPGRLDLFLGFGPRAESSAGQMKDLGRLFFLVLDPERPWSPEAEPGR